MEKQFTPAFMQDNSWPENAKKEFIAQLHKFNATVTEAAHLVEGLTELYIPKEDLSNQGEATQDKDLI